MVLPPYEYSGKHTMWLSQPMRIHQKIFNFGFNLEPISGLYENRPKTTHRSMHKMTHSKHTGAHLAHSFTHIILKKAFLTQVLTPYWEDQPKQNKYPNTQCQPQKWILSKRFIYIHKYICITFTHLHIYLHMPTYIMHGLTHP